MIFYQYYAEIPESVLEQFVSEQKLGRPVIPVAKLTASKTTRLPTSL